MRWKELRPGDVIFRGPLENASKEAFLVIRVGSNERFDTLMTVTVFDLQFGEEMMMAKPSGTELNSEYVILRGHDTVTG